MKQLEMADCVLYIFFIILFDQTLKLFVKTNFYYEETYQFTSWFNLRFIENQGMAWGAEIPGEYGKLFLTIFRIIALFGIGYWLWEVVGTERSKYLIYSVLFIFAGALGNIIDSVFYGVIFDESTTTHKAEYFAENNYGTWFHGKVVDMFEFPIWKGDLPSWIPFYGGQEFTFFNAIFNIADVSISLGVLILIIFNKKAFEPRKTFAGAPFRNLLDNSHGFWDHKFTEEERLENIRLNKEFKELKEQEELQKNQAKRR